MIRKRSKSNQSKYQYLAGNIALFSLSNFVSKILVFLLVPLYTNVLSTKEYGVADILQVTMLLLVPAATVNIGEAALRFGIERDKKRGSIFRIGMKYVLIADAVLAIAGLILSFFVSKEIAWYIFLFFFLFMSNSLFEFLIMFFQGSELVPIVVVGSVASTLITIISNIICLLVIKMGLNGYVLSQIIAFFTASIIMLILGRMASDQLDMPRDKALEKEMVSYGLPMIAYSTGSWINNASDRYLVAGICGSAANGIYGVAYKIPAILMVFQRIFAQAWQMSATKSYTDEKSDEFFTTMYKVYNTFMVVGCAFLILIVRFVAAFLFKKEFYEAWNYVPPLLISVIFGALTGFLGSICLAHKDSKSMGIATGGGAIVNILLNVLTIPRYGAMGAAWATAVSYCMMSFMAYAFVCKYVKLRNNIKKEIISYVILVIEAIVMISSFQYTYPVCIVLCGLLFAINIKEIKEIMINLLEIVKKKIMSRGRNDA